MTLRERIAAVIRGDAVDDSTTRTQYSRDTSIFSRIPSVVVFPKDAADVAALTHFVHAARVSGEDITLTARSAGTDMSGGPLTDSILMVFTKYMNHIGDITFNDSLQTGRATTEPGVYYRDFEKATLEKVGAILPSYPASRGLCAMGGIVNNNSGGELTLRYGKTARYVRSIDAVLSDGSTATFRPLSLLELEQKKSEQTLEGQIYREMHQLVEKNAAEIESNRPNVTKNSAGYALWNVLDTKKGTFDLTQVICGAQGTLSMMTSATAGLIKPKPHHAMLVVYLTDIGALPEMVKRILAFNPESFESYDDHTFSLAVRFMPKMLMRLGPIKMLALGLAFLPDVWAVMTGGVPKLILMAEFAEDTAEEALEKVRAARESLTGLACTTHIAKNEAGAAKYWTVRRESFALLRKSMHGLYAAPFIDDLVVHPNDYPTFLPELDALVRGHRFIYTIAGHIGDGNFHIIPLENMNDPLARKEILELMPKVYALVAKYKGSITGEHNDGIIRTPFLPLQFSPSMIELFNQTKNIWDPSGVFNPGKKVALPGKGGTLADIQRSMIDHS